MMFVAPMATWEFIGADLPTVRVRARSFDEALAEAKFRDSGYCAWRIVEEDEKFRRTDNENF